MLLLKNENMLTPLEQALKARNPRCVNLIMTLMS